ANGCSAVICECETDIPDGVNAVFVPKGSREALAKIASAFYGEPSKKFRLIGVTGTNGKTSSTYFMETILRGLGRKTGVIGTVGITVDGEKLDIEFATSTTPDTIELQAIFAEMAKRGVEDVIMEVSSHGLELKKVDGSDFDTCIFTNLTQDHLDFHKTMENYCAAKAKLFKICNKAVINIDDDGGKKIASDVALSKVTYGTCDADITATEIVLNPTGVEFDCLDTHFTLNIPGLFSVYNALASISICTALGVDKELIKDTLAKATGVKGRFEVYPTKDDYTVIIDYAHSPDGIKKILETVKGFAKGRIVILFGCGGDRDSRKRPQMGKIAGELADFCIITSDNPRSEEPAAIIRDILGGMKDATADYVVIENRENAIEYAIKNARKDDVIILAGKGHETYQILNDKTIHFDEREVLAKYLG
ncbi:MAG: UDP-N-acetylmuramoyl-L-alanyl-D-glutamate--2,6-diaminopimelate ligase, partial [Clostridia bacterium]|nr:UDP-N-acetylmuramoyl-L-alanyl-D-glutamate--2,6-diaminopimelate ligase [Clostridia bacterium]